MANFKYLDKDGLLYLWGQIKTKLGSKADKSTTYTKVEVDGIFDGANTPLTEHIEDNVNPHDVTKTQIGLGNVDNTSDLAKPVSTATNTALGLKADKSTMTTSLNKKVDKVTGKGLSTVDVTPTMKTKWDGAQPNVIESIKLNGVKVTPTSGKEVSLSVITGAQVDSKITNAIGNIVLFSPKVVAVLPTTGVPNILYVVPKTDGSGADVHSEYLWIDGAFEFIGSTKVDLTGYVKNTDLVGITNGEIDGVLAT